MNIKELIGKKVEFKACGQNIIGLVVSYDRSADKVTMQKGGVEFQFNLWLARSIRIIS